ncbi:MAG: hypothetical protein JXJ20_12995 [Anaerolineae bacterium]|nr:hypothetical protein [Anaerolineae bacterium]
MTDNPQPDKPSDMDKVQEYRKLVIEYETLDEEIDKLFASHNGAAEQMSNEDYEHYRKLARSRDDVHNQLKALERQILLDDEANSSR